jgi:glycerol-3-phosphate dehydrogenase (NAD(P)+)
MKVQVLGGGAWGMALSRLLAGYGHQTQIWVYDKEELALLRRERGNEALLPGIKLHESTEISADIMTQAEMVVYAVPSHAMRETAKRMRFSNNPIRVTVAKGIENETLLRMSEVIQESDPVATVVALSGPSHAEEVGRNLPACLVAASTEEAARIQVQEAFGGPSFRVYTSSDIVGVELGGALKNIIAIAAGACEGFGLGDNAKAALITRGLAEMIRLGVACGAEAATFAGLSGLGDLVVTCASRHSRNHRVGLCIAEGMTLEEILASSPKVAEGIRTAKSAVALAQKKQVEMPITTAVHDVLYEGENARNCITALMTRLMRSEWE